MKVLTSLTAWKLGMRSQFASGLALALAPCLSSCGVLNLLPPPSKLSIQATPTGCGSTVDTNRTNNWVVRFTVSGAAPEAPVQWTFSDGTSAIGQSIVKRFDSQTVEPVQFDVTIMAGGDIVTQEIEVPVRGTPDGAPDPDGDTCIPDESATHVPDGTQICYKANPPASGAHNSSAISPVAPGFYDEALATERWLHNIEHGGVVLLYDCGGTCSDDLKAQLRALFDSVPKESLFGQKKLVITRYSGTPSPCEVTPTFPASEPFLAIAWDVQRAFDTLDTAGILDFYARHVNHGREDAPLPP